MDSASLLWRWRVSVGDWEAAVASGLPGRAGGAFPGCATPPSADTLVAGLPAELLDRPATPFVALHAAIALAAAGDVSRLGELRRRCGNHPDPVIRTVVASVVDGLEDALAGEWGSAAARLEDVLPVLARVGGSAAQREVVEETLLWARVHHGDAPAAATLLEQRIDRRGSALDRRRLASMAPAVSQEPDRRGGVTAPVAAVPAGQRPVP